MNTPTNWKTVAVIHHPGRLKFWQAVFDGDRAPIKSIFTINVTVPEIGTTEAYMLDLNAITAEQREKLIRAISERFSIPVDEVAKEVDQGVPIPAKDVSVSSSDLIDYIDDIDNDDYESNYDPNEEDDWEDE